MQVRPYARFVTETVLFSPVKNKTTYAVSRYSASLKAFINLTGPLSSEKSARKRIINRHKRIPAV